MIALALLQSAPATADPDTSAWWALTSELSNDSMEGRDTGSRGYDRAAQIVARRFAAAGLKPLGDKGSWFQQVPMEEVAIARADIRIGSRKLRFLHDLWTSGVNAPAALDAPIAYRGYCAADTLGDVRGKVVICHATRRAGLPSDADRNAALTKAGAAAILAIADPGFTVEPPRWPFAYGRTIRLANAPAPAPGPVSFSFNADALGKIVAGTAMTRRN